MAQYVYTMSQVGKVVPPNRTILKDISLSFFPGAKIGVLGLNGAGKSTLLRIMAGIDTEYLGEARPQANLNVGYLPQEPALDNSKDVRGNVEDGLGEINELLKEFNAISDRFAEPMSEDEMTQLLDKQGDLQLKIDSSDGWNLERKMDIASDALRLPPWDAEVEHLSGGEKRRVALCRLLMSNPDMLLLDEPTNHLDAESVAWLERYLKEFPGTVVAITHDRYFLDNAAGWILELDRGYGIPYEGNYSDWLSAKEKRLQVDASKEVARQKSIRAELEWVRTQPKARQAKSKARLARFEELNSQDFQARNETQELYIPPGPRLGDTVLEVSDISKKFGETVLIDHLSFTVPRGAIIGIVGGNGAGKSTLFRMIAGTQQPDSGAVKVGETVTLGYVDQSRDSLEGDKTVWQEISEGNEIIKIGRYETQSRGYVSRFNFKGSDQQKFVKDLSGGERNRVHLAKLLKTGANLLLLDEPTNDLDVETLRALEGAIETFPGSMMIISHDRWFLDRLATHILAFEGDSHVEFFPGNYSEYEEDRLKRLGTKEVVPTRLKYKKLA
ncbi:MAG: energy-dependent translational throttle protein EttA [Gammaproteobacteria bacterium]|nr:energy-dependent translational throttle protein EttA [Gammaproteobacteria bacterium]MBT3868205.1 energy-dependent translational throttle protein EttA [Gammaproteobacteria bacterium]MBT4378429.1 energy-dependent translational throttle protein EttA [Gammaproteobacteria bacterium]MBT4615241.1 energy-dependent translational throttle protein EttA [Gammaproteobacteria bacterium]MBT5200145.1 energy-dependent translational throttle protein EttA [Gammaproteobacteria bacterium]